MGGFHCRICVLPVVEVGVIQVCCAVKRPCLLHRAAAEEVPAAAVKIPMVAVTVGPVGQLVFPVAL